MPSGQCCQSFGCQLSLAADRARSMFGAAPMGCFIWYALAAPRGLSATCHGSTDHGPWSMVHGVSRFSPVSRRWDVGTGARPAAGTGSPVGRTRSSYPACGDHREPVHPDPPRWVTRVRWENREARKSRAAKRHLLVDTLGLLFKVVVHPASLYDRQGVKLVLATLGTAFPRTAFPRLQLIWADQGYGGALCQWTKEHSGLTSALLWRSSTHGGGSSNAIFRTSSTTRRFCLPTRLSCDPMQVGGGADDFVVRSCLAAQQRQQRRRATFGQQRGADLGDQYPLAPRSFGVRRGSL